MILTLQEVYCWLVQEDCPGTSLSKWGTPSLKQQRGGKQGTEGRCRGCMEGKRQKTWWG